MKTFWVELLAALVADASAVVGARIERTRVEEELESPPTPSSIDPREPGELDLLAHLHLDVLDFDVAPASIAPAAPAAEPAFGVPSVWSQPAPAERPAPVRAPTRDWVDQERERDRERAMRPLPALMAAAPAEAAPAPTRGVRRRRVVAFACLVVPAVAAALTLPLAYETESDNGEAARREVATELTTPYVLPVAARDSEPAAVARDSVERALPAIPVVELPDAGLPTVDPTARTVVRPGDFTRGLPRPDSLR